jgi:hypothetical protein
MKAGNSKFRQDRGQDAGRARLRQILLSRRTALRGPSTLINVTDAAHAATSGINVTNNVASNAAIHPSVDTHTDAASNVTTFGADQATQRSHRTLQAHQLRLARVQEAERVRLGSVRAREQSTTRRPRKASFADLYSDFEDPIAMEDASERPRQHRRLTPVSIARQLGRCVNLETTSPDSKN